MATHRSPLRWLCLCIFLLASNTLFAEDSQPNPIVVIHTSKGPITLELYADKAPVTVANFLEYANSGFYDNTIFHRVIKRFMIQGGGYSVALSAKETRDPIVNESENGLHNDRYTVAMARKSDPDSATSQFFINTRINGALDARNGQPGYTVFGNVVEGKEIVRAIEKVETRTMGDFENVPVKAIVIERIEVLPAADTAQ